MYKQLLKKVDILSSLNDHAMDLLQEALSVVSFKSGDIICTEGEPGYSMYIVKSGEISVIKKGTSNNFVELTVLKPGEVAGLMSLFDDDIRTATLKARGDVEVLEIKCKDFQELLFNNPAITQEVLKVLTRYIQEENSVIIELKSRDIDNRLKVAIFDTKPYDVNTLVKMNNERYSLKFYDSRLTLDTSSLADGYKIICVFVNDDLKRDVIEKLASQGVKMIALRCAGYNNVDLKACKEYGISVANVPVYSPYAVAEHSVALMLSLNRHIPRAFSRVRDSNYSLDGLVGFDMHGKTVGIIGAGRIGQCAINILSGFGCSILAYDRNKINDPRDNIRDVELDELLAKSDIISLHAPLVPDTRHIINEENIQKMKDGVMIINTSRGALVDTQALINGLLSGKVGSAGLDVYEEEGGYFFEDYSNKVLKDDILARLNTFHNVIMTGHMAFLTNDALINIADVTIKNIMEYESGKQGKEITNGLIPS